MIRVLLADDHGVIRDGLGRLIAGARRRRARRRGGRRRRGRRALPRELTPDVVLMDLDMPRARRHRGDAADPRRAPGDRGARADRRSPTARGSLGALEAGACGYLLKDVDADEVAEGIRAAARGESPLDPRAARTILDARAGARPARGPLAARARGARAARRGAAEQADRAPPGDQREDRQVAPDADLPRARRHRPHAGGAVGRAPRRLGADADRDQSPIAQPDPRRRHACSLAVRRPRRPRDRSSALALAAAPALARDDGRARRPARCGSGRRVARCGCGPTTARSGSSSRCDSRRRGERWRVALVHERRVVWRGRVRTRSGALVPRPALGARLRRRRRGLGAGLRPRRQHVPGRGHAV